MLEHLPAFPALSSSDDEPSSEILRRVVMILIHSIEENRDDQSLSSCFFRSFYNGSLEIIFQPGTEVTEITERTSVYVRFPTWLPLKFYITVHRDLHIRPVLLELHTSNATFAGAGSQQQPRTVGESYNKWDQCQWAQQWL